ncbi:hypothetical protein [Lysobacter sp. CA199]|uniref:hypothetical protein n=1 Tax=Lysobacter sp. CA199 TaxID=3455608 RepID=UPI003F8D6DD7
MALKAKLRRIGKRIPPVYWLGGLVNYLGFRRELAREQALYDAQSRRGPVAVPPMLRSPVIRRPGAAGLVVQTLFSQGCAHCRPSHSGAFP